jgi:hypothetical protein
MADKEKPSPPREIALRARAGRGALRLRLQVGDGLVAEWTVAVAGGPLDRRLWKGSTADGAPEEAELPEAGLVDGAICTVLVLIFGPAVDSPYHVELEATQGGQSVLQERQRWSGKVQARRTTSLSARIPLGVMP